MRGTIGDHLLADEQGDDSFISLPDIPPTRTSQLVLDPQQKDPRLIHFVFLSAFWYGYQVMWTALALELLPGQVTVLGGENDQSSNLAAVYSTGAVLSLIYPAVGRWSDRSLYKHGRRRVFIFVGSLCAGLCLVGMAFAGQLWLLAVFYMCFTICTVTAAAPFNGLVADVTPESQRGRMSGVLAGMGLLGNLTGAGLGGVYSSEGTVLTIFVIVAVFECAMLVTVLLVKERRPDPKARMASVSVAEFFQEMWRPMRNHDFRWVFFTRFLMEMGQFTVQEYLLYFLGSPFVHLLGMNAKLAEVTCLVPLLLCGAIGSYVCGYFSDKTGRRKPYVLGAGLLMAGANVLFTFTRDQGYLIPISGLFGAGFGTYYAVDYALALDVLPDKENIGKDLNVWYLALVIPQALAVPIGAGVLRSLNHTSQAYAALFGVTAAYTLLGGVLIFFVRNVK